jgi:hypothetical protein
MQLYFEAPKSNSIQIGDYIEVLEGEHRGRHGIVDWFAKGDTSLWFWDILAADDPDLDNRLGTILVPIGIVQQTDLRKMVQFTKEKGYDIRPGDVVTVACGLECGMKGIIQSINFPNAHLTVLCAGDYSLVSMHYLDSCISDLQ